MTKRTKIILAVVTVLAIAGAVYYFLFHKKKEVTVTATPVVGKTAEIPTDLTLPTV